MDLTNSRPWKDTVFMVLFSLSTLPLIHCYLQLVNPEKPVLYRHPVFHLLAPSTVSGFSDQDLGD